MSKDKSKPKFKKMSDEDKQLAKNFREKYGIDSKYSKEVIRETMYAFVDSPPTSNEELIVMLEVVLQGGETEWGPC